MEKKRYLMLLGVILILASIFPISALAQITFERTYGGINHDFGYSVQQTSDGGYVIAGRTDSFGAGGADVWLIKTDADGDTLWTRTYGGTGSEYGHYVQQTSDGGYIIAGFISSIYEDVYLIKTDSDGKQLWKRAYGGSSADYGYSVQQTSDGGYIIAGWTDSWGGSDRDVYLIKTDSDGKHLWKRTYGGTTSDYGYSVQQTSDGGYIIAGWTDSFGGSDSDVYLIKTDASGNTLWTRTYGGTSSDYGYSVQHTSDGGYIIAGDTDSFGGSDRDVYLIKTDASGDTLWTRTYGGTRWDGGNSVQQTSDGGYIIAGYTESFGSGGRYVYLIKTDAGGDTLWTRNYGWWSSGYGESVKQTSDGGYVIAGWTVSGRMSIRDVYLVKTDASGLTPVEEDYVKGTPSSFNLSQNYPNPFNPSTTFRFNLQKACYVTLKLFDLLGHEIETIISGQRVAGEYEVEWTAEGLPTGIYLYRLEAGDYVETKKLILQK